MKKKFIIVFLFFIVYGLALWGYLYGASAEIPRELQGTSADPQTFMTSKELLLSEEYSTIRNFLSLLSAPYEWLILLFLLMCGWSKKFNVWAEKISKRNFMQTVIYLFWLSLATLILSAPLQWVRYKLSLKYGISVQSLHDWIKEQFIDFWFNYVLMIIIIHVIYMLIRYTKKRWWFYTWVLSIPFTLFLTFIQPVVIAPLYDDFSPLQNKQLEEKILQLADKVNIPADHVYEVNKSEETNALNAYVTGIGSNSRIVLWDTTLERLTDDEILFIMAHEMGHYTMKHVYYGLLGSLVLSLVGLYLVHKIMGSLYVRYKKKAGISSLGSLVTVPLLLFIISMLSFAASPLTNYVSRAHEKKADEYAIELVENKEAAVSSFQKLSKAGLSQVNPPSLVKFFQYTHPPILERMQYIQQHK